MAARPEARMSDLKAQIKRHNRLYFDRAAPTISDPEYDRLYAELLALEEQYPALRSVDSPTRFVGCRPNIKLGLVRHRSPMLSLEKALNRADLERFCARLQAANEGMEPTVVGLPKLDGLAVNLIYIDRNLFRGATRGDGRCGEDVTANLLHVAHVPRQLPAGAPGLVEVRGEVIMPGRAFARLNSLRRDSSEAEYVNPRNAAAGSLRQIDEAKSTDRGLELHVFALQAVDSAYSLRPSLALLAEWGFSPVQNVAECSNAAAMIAFSEHLRARQASFDYGIDGAVFTVDEVALQERMGANAREPRYAIAYKFAPQEASTVVRDVIYQLGRSGVVTPVAKVAPVFVGGVTVSSVTLHNISYLRSLRLHEGDTIDIVRAGDVIPKLIKVREAERRPASKLFEPPNKCPVCASQLKSQSVHLLCVNQACRGQFLQDLLHFVSRSAMDVKGLESSRLAELIDKGHLKRISDVFFLDQRKLRDLDRMAERSIARLIGALNRARQTTLGRLLHALGIAGLGATKANLLAERFGSFRTLAHAMPETIAFNENVGLTVARRVKDALRSRIGDEVERLRFKLSWPEPGPQEWRLPLTAFLVHHNYLVGQAKAGLLADNLRKEIDQDFALRLFSKRALAVVAKRLNDVRAKLGDLPLKAGGSWAGLRKGLAESAPQGGDDQAIGRSVELLASDYGQRLGRELEQLLGVVWTWSSSPDQQHPLTDRVVVVSGTIEGLTRSEVADLLRQHGAKLRDTVSARTDFLVFGERPSQSKCQRAEALGLRVLSFADFAAMFALTAAS